GITGRQSSIVPHLSRILRHTMLFIPENRRQARGLTENLKSLPAVAGRPRRSSGLKAQLEKLR
ncbi:MAG TPA: hypothetical protein VLK33_14635, partial [Terriglobales bacterium]|nr:hypothetical protein [Terriglobales bacterium]